MHATLFLMAGTFDMVAGSIEHPLDGMTLQMWTNSTEDGYTAAQGGWVSFRNSDWYYMRCHYDRRQAMPLDFHAVQGSEDTYFLVNSWYASAGVNNGGPEDDKVRYVAYFPGDHYVYANTENKTEAMAIKFTRRGDGFIMQNKGYGFITPNKVTKNSMYNTYIQFDGAWMSAGSDEAGAMFVKLSQCEDTPPESYVPSPSESMDKCQCFTPGVTAVKAKYQMTFKILSPWYQGICSKGMTDALVQMSLLNPLAAVALVAAVSGSLASVGVLLVARRMRSDGAVNTANEAFLA